MLNEDGTKCYQAITLMVYLAHVTRDDCVQHMPACPRHVEAVEDSHGCSKASSSTPRWNSRFQYHVLKGRIQTHSVFRR